MRPYHSYAQSLTDPLVASGGFWVGQDSTHYYTLCTDVGPLYKSTVACLDLTTGAKLHDVVDVEGLPTCIISDGSGGIYVGGALMHINGVNTPGQSIVHIHSDGTLDNTFSVRFSGSMGQYYQEPQVTAMVLLSGTLYVGGFGLCTLNGTYLNGTSLCAVNATTGAKVAWDPFTSPVTYEYGTGGSLTYNNPEISYMVTDGTNIFVSGNLVVVSNAITHTGFIKIDPTTAVIDDTWVPSSALPRHIAYFGGGNLVVANSTSVNLLDATTGATGGALISGINGGVTAMVTDVANGKVYVTGFFGVGFTPKLGSNAWGGVTIPHVGGLPLPSLAIDSTGTNLYLGNTAKYLASNGTLIGSWGATDTDWDCNGVIDGTAFWGCAANLSTVAKVSRHALAQINKSDGTLTSWNPNVTPNGNAAVIEGTIYVGGAGFIHLYAVDTTTGTFTDYISSIVGTTGDLDATGNDVYVVGGFSSLNGVAHARVAKFTSGVLTAWTPTTPETGNIGLVKLSPDGTKLVYATFNGAVTALDTATGNQLWTKALTLTGAFSADLFCITFSPDSSKVYLGGQFDTIGGTAGHVAIGRLDSTTGALDSWNPNVFAASAFATINAIATVGDYVYWCGSFVLGANNILRNGAMCVKASDATWTSTWDPPHPGNDFNDVQRIMIDAPNGRLLTSTNAPSVRNKRRSGTLQFHSGTPDDPGGPDLTTPITPGAITQTKTFASSGDISSFNVTLDQPLSRGGSLFLFLAFSNPNVRLPGITFEAGSAAVFADVGEFAPQQNSSGTTWDHGTNPGFQTYQTAIWFAAGDNSDQGDQELDAPPQVLTIKWDLACSVACAMVEIAGLNTDVYDTPYGLQKMSNADSATVTSGTNFTGVEESREASVWGIATSGATVYSGLTSTHMTYTVGPSVASTGGSGNVAIQLLYDTTTTLAAADHIDFSVNIAPSRKYAAWHWGVDLISTGNAV